MLANELVWAIVPPLFSHAEKAWSKALLAALRVARSAVNWAPAADALAGSQWSSSIRAYAIQLVSDSKPRAVEFVPVG